VWTHTHTPTLADRLQEETGGSRGSGSGGGSFLARVPRWEAVLLWAAVIGVALALAPARWTGVRRRAKARSTKHKL
jgi:hypothetical protein